MNTDDANDPGDFSRRQFRRHVRWSLSGQATLLAAILFVLLRGADAHSAAWEAGYYWLLGALIVFLAILSVGVSRPRLVPGAVLPAERRPPRFYGIGDWILACFFPLGAVAAFACLLGQPSGHRDVFLLSATSSSASPQAHAHDDPLVRGWVEAACRRLAAQSGPSAWSRTDPQAAERIRRAVREDPDDGQVGADAAFPQEPIWVVQSVELAVLEAESHRARLGRIDYRAPELDLATRDRWQRRMKGHGRVPVVNVLPDPDPAHGAGDTPELLTARGTVLDGASGTGILKITFYRHDTNPLLPVPWQQTSLEAPDGLPLPGPAALPTTWIGHYGFASGPISWVPGQPPARLRARGLPAAVYWTPAFEPNGEARTELGWVRERWSNSERGAAQTSLGFPEWSTADPAPGLATASPGPVQIRFSASQRGLAVVGFKKVLDQNPAFPAGWTEKPLDTPRAVRALPGNPASIGAWSPENLPFAPGADPAGVRTFSPPTGFIPAPEGSQSISWGTSSVDLREADVLRSLPPINKRCLLQRYFVSGTGAYVLTWPSNGSNALEPEEQRALWALANECGKRLELDALLAEGGLPANLIDEPELPVSVLRRTDLAIIAARATQNYLEAAVGFALIYLIILFFATSSNNRHGEAFALVESD